MYADKKHYMYQVMFSVMLATECRIGEICALTWDNIDFENDRIHICKHFTVGKTGSYIRDGCKTNAGDRWLNSFTEKNGLPRIHPHMFRHTSVSLQLQAGISIADAAKRAGHARPDVTLRIYSHTLKKNELH
ncbi:MAG: site-specific integrase [Ruminococcus sp.]|nr:site-specific integrase [Ruminococcus sp.]